jgi:hypothetical protein
LLKSALNLGISRHRLSRLSEAALAIPVTTRSFYKGCQSEFLLSNFDSAEWWLQSCSGFYYNVTQTPETTEAAATAEATAAAASATA